MTAFGSSIRSGSRPWTGESGENYTGDGCLLPFPIRLEIKMIREMLPPEPVSLLMVTANQATIIAAIGVGAVKEIIRLVERTIEVRIW
jgi:hypothetical protein